QFVVVHIAHQTPVDPVLTLSRCVQAADQIHKRRLAGARRSHNGKVLIPFHDKGHSSQSMNLFCSHFVGLPEILCLDEKTVGASLGFIIRHAFDILTKRQALTLIASCSTLQAKRIDEKSATYPFRSSLTTFLLSTLTLSSVLMVRSVL